MGLPISPGEENVHLACSCTLGRCARLHDPVSPGVGVSVSGAVLVSDERERLPVDEVGFPSVWLLLVGGFVWVV